MNVPSKQPLSLNTSLKSCYISIVNILLVSLSAFLFVLDLKKSGMFEHLLLMPALLMLTVPVLSRLTDVSSQHVKFSSWFVVGQAFHTLSSVIPTAQYLESPTAQGYCLVLQGI